MWPPEPSQSPPEGACTSNNNAQDQLPTTQAESNAAISHLLTADHIDMNMLSTLLGSTTDMNSGKPDDASESTELHSITTEAVLQGIHSLDEFERQAATQESSYGGSGSSKDDEDKITAYMSNPSTTATGFGSFNETELSAALEQLYWDSLDLPIAGSMTANVDSITAAAASESESSMLLVAPTPTPTPVTTAWAMRNSGSISAVATDRTELTEDDYEEEENEDVDNPLELEELSLFSLFLSDMPAFETFLENLSLNQLRQCAATVNRALAHRESTFNDSDFSTKVIEEPAVKNNDASFPDKTLALLREWLPPSTADCVITALKEADLTIPGLSTGGATKATSSGSRSEMQANRLSNSDAAKTAMDKIGNTGGLLSPATDPTYLSNDPILETDSEDIPWLSFVYAQKGKPKRHRIRIDIDRAPLNVIPSTFKNHNCVYPRANCSKSDYAGNRWNYETECNGLGWQLAFLNQELMSDRRGLLQTAVNNYRTLVAGRKSRRITRLEKAERNQQSGNKRSLPVNGATRDSEEKRIKVATTSKGNVNSSSASAAVSSEEKEQAPLMIRTNSAPAPQAHQQSLSSSSLSSVNAKCLNINAYINGKSSRIRVYVDFGSVNEFGVGSQFRTDHAVFPRVLNAPKARYSGGLQGRWEFELTCNEIAWRLAWLNRSRLQGRVPLIQRCLDAYRTRFAVPPWSLLLCYKEQMGESVNPRFFDYWKPRPGKKGLGLPPSPTASELPVAEGKVLAKSTTALPSLRDETTPSSVAISKKPENSSKTAASPVVTPAMDSSKVDCTAARTLVVRPKAIMASKVSPNTSSAATSPKRPFPPPVNLPVRPPPRQAPVPSRPPAIPKGSVPTRPRPPIAAPARPNAPKRPLPRPAPRLPVQKRPPLPPSSSSPSQPLPVRATRPPLPVGNVQKPAINNNKPIQQRPPPISPESSSKSAKAQAAANILTDVLRRLAKSDPALAPLNGVLEKRDANDGNAGTGKQSSSEKDDNNDEDDSTPLDAKVAELEKLILTIQKN